MLVLHVIIDLTAGGAELMLLRLVQAAGPGVCHHVISLRTVGPVGERLRAAGIPVEALGLSSPLQLVGVLWRLSRRIRALKPNLVQTWMYHADLIGGLAARAAGVRALVWNVRLATIAPGMGVAPATRWVRRLCASLSARVPARIVYVAEAARADHEAVGYARDRGVVIPNGYDLPDPPAAAVAAIRTALAIPADGLIVASAGRYNAQKDHAGFVAAAAIVAEAREDVWFVMMGRGVDADTPPLRDAVTASGCADRFRLLGERRDVSTVMAASDLFCLHSVNEGFPNVVAEAMAAATPCVVTDVGDAALLARDTGAVVPPARPDLLARAILTELNRPAADRDARGRAARERIARDFSMQAISRRYQALYADVIGATVQGT